MNPTLASVVEGHGEMTAVPELLRRLVYARAAFSVNVLPPIRCLKNKIVRCRRGAEEIDSSELERAIRLAARRLPSPDRGAILILIDADTSCPASVGSAIRELAMAVCPTVPIGVVLPKHEYEAWLLAAVDSLGNYLSPSAVPVRDPEAVQDPKRRLSELMPHGRSYRETVDQVRFSSIFDLEQARTCRSFRKLESEVDRLLRIICRETADGAET